LFAALEFLGQRPPRELSGAGLQALWTWATDNWQLARVPRGPVAIGAGQPADGWDNRSGP
jgi:hypothetical protein